MKAGLVIVGAGICGLHAAHATREGGFAGPITVIGDDQEWPYERPPLSKWDGGEPRLIPIFPPEFYQEADISLMRGTVVAEIDPAAQTVTLSSGEMLAFDHLLLATGAAPKRIKLDHLTDVSPAYLRDYAQAKKLATHITAGSDVLIIGGGFIGLELAASLSAKRCFVHVVEMQGRVLARALPKPIAQRVQELHARNGVTIHTGTQIAAFRDGVASLSSGVSVRAGHIIVGIGSVPRIGLAQASGLTIDDGIVVDEAFKTSAPNIYAAGDCCAAPLAGVGRVRMESWQVAADQGRRAGQIIAGQKPDATLPPWFWSDQYDHSLQVVGWPLTASDNIIRPLPMDGLLCLARAPDGKIAHAAGFAPGNAVGREIKLIQRIMQAGLAPAHDALADPETSLKSLLKRS